MFILCGKPVGTFILCEVPLGNLQFFVVSLFVFCGGMTISWRFSWRSAIFMGCLMEILMKIHNLHGVPAHGDYHEDLQSSWGASWRLSWRSAIFMGCLMEILMKIHNLHGVPHGDSHEDPAIFMGCLSCMIIVVYEQSRLKILWGASLGSSLSFFIVWNCLELKLLGVSDFLSQSNRITRIISHLLPHYSWKPVVELCEAIVSHHISWSQSWWWSGITVIFISEHLSQTKWKN